MEGAASRRINEPVSIAQLHMSILPSLEFKLDNVKIGQQLDVQLTSVKVYPDLGSLFSDQVVIRRMEVDGLVTSAEALARIVAWARHPSGGQGGIDVRRIVVRNAKIAVKGFDAPSFDVDIVLSHDAQFRGGNVKLSDGTLKAELTPTDAGITIEASGKAFRLPMGPPIIFDDLVAKGVATENGITLSEVEGLLYGGSVKGNVQMTWTAGWSLATEFETGHVELFPFMETLTKDARSSGQLDAKAKIEMASATLGTLMEAPQAQASFVLRKGTLDGIDLVRALQTPARDGIRGGKSRFDELTGNLTVSGGRFQFRNLRLQSGLLVATGQFDVLPNQDVSGRVQVELKSTTNQFRGNFAILGTLKAMMLKP